MSPTPSVIGEKHNLESTADPIRISDHHWHHHALARYLTLSGLFVSMQKIKEIMQLSGMVSCNIMLNIVRAISMFFEQIQF